MATSGAAPSAGSGLLDALPPRLLGAAAVLSIGISSLRGPFDEPVPVGAGQRSGELEA